MPRSRLPWLPLFAALAAAGPASAYDVDINNGPETIYLRVGDGLPLGTYLNGQPQAPPPSGGNISRVEVDVPLGSVGTGAPLTMTANSRVTSDLDNFQFCNAGQLYIGGFYRRNNNGKPVATLTVLAPATLTNTVTNESIPISHISWTSAGNAGGGRTGTASQPLGSGTFQAGQQTFPAGFVAGTWRETCLTFRYANTLSPGPGVYNARIVYTLTSP